MLCYDASISRLAAHAVGRENDEPAKAMPVLAGVSVAGTQC
jgi:hypothetical protein